MTTKYIVYADGACSGNPGPGGWAFEVKNSDNGDFYAGCEGAGQTTNNIMELTAAVHALETLYNRDGNAPGEVVMRLDSQYVLDGLFKWLPGWKAKGWKTAGKKPVKNREVWERLDTAYSRLIERGFTFTPEWVKGHDGEPGNERVDTAAQEQRDRYSSMMTMHTPKSEVAMEAAIGAGRPMEDVPMGKAAASFMGMAEVDGEGLTTPAGTPVGYNNAGFDQMTPLGGSTEYPEPLGSIYEKVAAQVHPSRMKSAPQGKSMMVPAEVHPGQVDLMRTILDLYASGDYSVKKVVEQIRENAVALGCR